MAKGIKISTTDVLLIGGGLLAFTAIKRLLIAGGLAAGPGTQAASQNITDPGSYWKPQYYKRVGGRFLTRSVTESYARHRSIALQDRESNQSNQLCLKHMPLGANLGV